MCAQVAFSPADLRPEAQLSTMLHPTNRYQKLPICQTLAGHWSYKGVAHRHKHRCLELTISGSFMHPSLCEHSVIQQVCVAALSQETREQRSHHVDPKTASRRQP